MRFSKYHNKLRGIALVLVALSAKAWAPRPGNPSGLCVASNTLLMKGLLAGDAALGVMAGSALHVRVAGIEFRGVQNVVVLLVIYVVTGQAVVLAHVQIMGKCNRIALVRAGRFLDRACRQHGNGKNAAEYQQYKNSAKQCFFG